MLADALIMVTVTDPSGEVDAEPVTVSALPGGGVQLELWDGQQIVLGRAELAAVDAVASAGPVRVLPPAAA